MIKSNPAKMIVLSLILMISSFGCDIFKTISENFSKKETSPAVSTTKPSTDTSSDRVKETMSTVSMSKDVLAVVGNWSISKSEFKERLAALKQVVPEYNIDDVESKKLVLEELIRQQLLVGYAEKTGLSNKKDIKAAVEEFRRTLIVREVARELTEDIEISDKELREFYEEKKDVLVQPAQWRVGEIVIDDQIKASELLTELLKGSSFEEAAKSNSTSASAANGGDLGFISDVAFPEMGNTLLTLEEGGVSSVVKGPDGYYIFKLIAKKGGEQIAFEDIEADIKQNRTLFKQQQAILDYIEDLRKKTNVEINEDAL